MNDNPSPAGAAIKSPYDDRDFLLSEVIPQSAAPFDWDKGYDGENDLGQALGFATFLLPTKDQNGSGSCGGQAEATGGASLSAFHEKVFEEKSAKFTYAPVASKPGGGSTGRALSDRAISAGWGSEALTPSYENGLPPSEAFMERAQDITPEAVKNALKDRALNYVLIPQNIDALATAISTYKFARLGVIGSNNGSWRTEDPIPPSDAEARWYHWMAGLKAKMRNGKKAIGVKNSWGPNTGQNGWQWLNEDWFQARLSNDPYGAIPIFEPRCYVWNDQPLPPSFTHTFLKDLFYGSIDPENIFLQTALRIDGEFPAGVPYNEAFGPATLGAVQKFQVKYGISAPGLEGYGRVGPLTRTQLNKLFSK